MSREIVLFDSDKIPELYMLNLKQIDGFSFDKNNFNKSQFFFINLNTSPIKDKEIEIQQKPYRTSFNGISILKYIRALGYKNHCILYSFLSLEQILKNHPEHFIICSPGTTFIQLPFDFSKLDYSLLRSLDSTDECLPFLKTAFSIEKYRHAKANWYGLEQFWNSHAVYIKANNKLELPEFLVNQRKDLNNLLALLLKGNSGYVGIKKRDDIEISRERISRKSNIILHIDDQAKNGWSEIIFRALFDKNNVSIKEEGKKPSDDGEFILRNKGRFITEYRIKSNKMLSYTGFPCDIGEEEFHFVNILDILDKERIDLVLLDLRLQDESSNIKMTSNLSGIRLLERIRHDYFHKTSKHIGLPIILTTASNKYRSYVSYSKLIDDVWIKEGIDEGLSIKQSQSNYFSLIQKSLRYLSTEYQLGVKLFATKIYDLVNSEDIFWWNQMEIEGWKNFSSENNRIVDRKNAVVRLLYLIWEQIRNFSSYSNIENDFALSDLIYSMAINIGKVIEIVHRIDLEQEEYNRNTIVSNTLETRKDWLGLYFYRIRNRAAHYYSLDKEKKRVDRSKFNIINECITGIRTAEQSDSLVMDFDSEMKQNIVRKTLMFYLTSYNPLFGKRKSLIKNNQ